jgi:hypothetical protein
MRQSHRGPARLLVEQSFLRVHVAGLSSSRKGVRSGCFHELRASGQAEMSGWDMRRPQQQPQEGDQIAYCENDLLAPLVDLLLVHGSQKAGVASCFRNRISSHAELHSLLGIAFGKSDDKTIQHSAVKQLTATIIKDSNILLTMDKAVCIDIISNLNEIITENCGVFHCIEESSSLSELFVAHCALLLRSVLLAVPALLREVRVCPQPQEGGEEEEEGGDEGICAAYVLRFALLAHTSAWGRAENRNSSLTTFTVCCQDILRLWALRPTDFKNCKLRYGRPPPREPALPAHQRDDAHVALPGYCASEFCAANYSVLPPEVRDKYFSPLLFQFSSYCLLNADNTWRHPTVSTPVPLSGKDDNEATDRCVLCYSTAVCVCDHVSNVRWFAVVVMYSGDTRRRYPLSCATQRKIPLLMKSLSYASMQSHRLLPIF